MALGDHMRPWALFVPVADLVRVPVMPPAVTPLLFPAPPTGCLQLGWCLVQPSCPTEPSPQAVPLRVSTNTSVFHGKIPNEPFSPALTSCDINMSPADVRSDGAAAVQEERRLRTDAQGLYIIVL